MAGVARHVLLTVREGAVDCTNHRDHSARDLLRPFLIGGPVLDVTMVARSFIQQAQGLYEALHRGREVRSTKNLNVFATAASSRTCCRCATAASTRPSLAASRSATRALAASPSGC